MVLTGSRDEGDDLARAACLEAFVALDRYRPGTRFDAWMLRPLRTGWLDRVRFAARRRHAADRETLESISNDWVGARDAEARLTLARARAAMAALPPVQREALSLGGIEGLSHREAAEVLGCPIGTAMSRLGRARARLGAMMQECAA